MDSRLFMEIGFVNTTFQAIDRSPYERWINDGVLDGEHAHLVAHRILQIIDGDSPIVKETMYTIADSIEILRNPFQVENLTNGLYYYQKLIIPVGEHVTEANEHLYYSDGKVYYEDVDSGTCDSYALNNMEDFDEVYEIIRKHYPDNCFYFDDYSFTIYDLIECYVMTERERINTYLKNNCDGSCMKARTDIDSRADILLGAIMVLKDLMEKGDYFEAQRILNGLNTCGSLCKKYIKSLKGCGCGRS